MTTQDGHKPSHPFVFTQPAHKYPVGTRVAKRGGDYTFEGVVVCTFTKLSGALRYVVEDDRGCVHIFNEGQLELT